MNWDQYPSKCNSKGTNRGTTTDFDGEFSIEAAKGEIIVISLQEKIRGNIN